jgi:arginine-tRNA-protein transferase
MTTVRLFQSTTYPCSYLPGYDAKNLFTSPHESLSPEIYDALITIGFRRSGEIILRPACDYCQQCVSLRIPVSSFTASKNQRRTIKLNHDIKTNVIQNPDYSKYHSLYERYILHRHPDSESMQDVENIFATFLASKWSNTFSIEFLLPTNELVCVAICDSLNNGWSDVYTFYNPDYAKRSLGTFAILAQIKLLQQRTEKYLYLGYWIKDCHKMNYKTQFKPCEGFINNKWILLDD